ncbi:unnamed protein product, partial [Ectocarpus sp. 12 AP-2014]
MFLSNTFSTAKFTEQPRLMCRELCVLLDSTLGRIRDFLSRFTGYFCCKGRNLSISHGVSRCRRFHKNRSHGGMKQGHVFFRSTRSVRPFGCDTLCSEGSAPHTVRFSLASFWAPALRRVTPMWILLDKSDTSRGIYDVARVGRSRRQRVGLHGLFWLEVCS